MKRWTTQLAAVAIFASFLTAGGQGTAAAQPPPGVIPDHYIVVLRDAVNPRQVADEHSREQGAQVSHVYEFAIKGYAARIPAPRLAAIRADNRVLFISEDREVEAFAQTLPTGVNRIQGDASSTLSGNGSGIVSVAVAIIDTGIDIDHPDLNVVGGKNCSSGSSFDDGNGHGSHVAGTVGARDNGIGVVGVVPGAPLYAVRVLNNAGFGSWSSVICGVDWVTGRRAEYNDGPADGDPGINIAVANMSLGGSGNDGNCGPSNTDALHAAICSSVAAGVTYVVAAGNSNTNFSGFVPATYSEVLTVTAMADFNGLPGGGAAATCRSDVDDTAADFSNFTAVGSSDAGHTIAAPGVCIKSTWKGGGYNTISGTSMASPHVAGTAALCFAGPCAGMTPSQVMAKLRADAAIQSPAYIGTPPPGYYGFTNEPNSPNGTRYYGHLVYAGGY